MRSLCVFGRLTALLLSGFRLKNFMSLIMQQALWGLHSLSVVKHYGQENSKPRLISSATLKPDSRVRAWHWGDEAAEFWDVASEKSRENSPQGTCAESPVEGVWLRHGAETEVYLLYQTGPAWVTASSFLLPAVSWGSPPPAGQVCGDLIYGGTRHQISEPLLLPSHRNPTTCLFFWFTMSMSL